MGTTDRRSRERAARRRLITAAARDLAERDGWDAVTTRRLSSEIEYSQPVIYTHFASMEDVVEAVALEGFDELAGALVDAQSNAVPAEALSAAAHAYADFAARNPALYDAMFTRATRLRFGPQQASAPLRSAFSALRAVAAPIVDGRDLDTLTELLWAALHGLTTLSRHDRLRPGYDTDRLDLLVAQFRARGASS